MLSEKKVQVTQFIEQVWNKRNFAALHELTHPHYKDHSLPAGLPPGAEGTEKWVVGTTSSFEHTTLIEELVCEEDKCMMKIRMALKHTGTWRGIDPTFEEVNTNGYRFFKFSGGKIIEHWALIDGETIENQLRNSSHSCQIPVK
ncbi:MAG: ester cyclase [Rufibacter sp.]